MAETEEQQSARAGSDKLYTLSEIAKLTGVSMPTLQRYKKLYQGRIPSVGEGRRQRYPESALPVFNELKVENAGRRGRPRKDASAPAAPARGRKPAGRKASSARPRAAAKPAQAAKSVRTAGRRGRPAASAGRRGARAQVTPKRGASGRGKEGLLTLTQISKDTGISYPTLVRYVRLYAHRLPHEGTGRARRFYPKAVDVFRSLRQESGRGERRRGPAAAAGRGREEAGLARQIRDIEKSQRALEKKLDTLLRGLKKAFA